jgi:hypothetical protein
VKQSFAIICVLSSCVWFGACAEGQTNGPPGPDAASSVDARVGGFIDADLTLPDARVFPDANTSFPDANNSFPDAATGGTCTMTSQCPSGQCCDTLASQMCVAGLDFMGLCLPL